MNLETLSGSSTRGCDTESFSHIAPISLFFIHLYFKNYNEIYEGLIKKSHWWGLHSLNLEFFLVLNFGIFFLALLDESIPFLMPQIAIQDSVTTLIALSSACVSIWEVIWEIGILFSNISIRDLFRNFNFRLFYSSDSLSSLSHECCWFQLFVIFDLVFINLAVFFWMITNRQQSYWNVVIIWTHSK